MIYSLSSIISFYVGYQIIALLSNKNKSISTVDIFLSIGLGFLIISQTIFYSILLFDEIKPFYILLINIVAVILLFMLRIHLNKIKIAKDSSIYKDLIRLTVVFYPLIMLSIMLALCRPFGDWDAWSFWNLRANFLLRSGHHWKNIFILTEQSKHPWLLSLSVLWGWIVAGKENNMTPIVTSILFLTSTIGLLVCSLTEQLKRNISFLAGIFLLSIPFFITHSTSQYSDIVAGYYLLATLVLIKKTYETKSRKYSLLAGLFIGALSFTKDEGVALAFIITVILVLSNMNKCAKGEKIPISTIFFGTLLIIPSTVLVKFILPFKFFGENLPIEKSISIAHVLDVNRCAILGKFILNNVILNPAWGGFWIVCIIAIATNTKQINTTKDKIFLSTIVIFISVILFRFLTTAEPLIWHLNVALNRVLFILVPTLTYFIFYLSFKNKEII
ncbi:MAG: glycosyltransferase family 39 protein [Candidatus Zapsychrus exili]|nr:glycosyltransferase family 39 protein [Candidatus Zapsychrus exili]